MALTDEELAVVRATIQRGMLLPPGTDSETLVRASQLLQAANTLLAEVDNLRASEAELLRLADNVDGSFFTPNGIERLTRQAAALLKAHGLPTSEDA